MKNYISTIYNESERPKTDYPKHLVKYLFNKFHLKRGQTFLEPGCGRGDFLIEFKKLGLEAYGIDISEESKEIIKDCTIKISDIEKDGIPFPDNYFDVIYSKSFIEHMYHPENYFEEAYRVLKKGGILITLVPDWEANYKIYFDDYTHRTPFTIFALKDIYKMYQFKDIYLEKFRQLPIVWKHKWINLICSIISPFIPVRTKNNFLRWSRELMIIGIGYKE